MPVGSKAFDIPGRILDVKVGTDGCLIRQEAQIPVRNVVSVQPIDRLLHRDAVEVLDKESVRNDSYPNPLGGQPSKHLRGADDWLQVSKEIPLRNRELMQLAVPARRLIDAPLGQVPGDRRRQGVWAHTEPLSGNWPKPFIKISASAVEIDSEHKGRSCCGWQSGAPFLLESSSRMPQSELFGSVFELERRCGASWPHIHTAFEAGLALHERLREITAGEPRDDAAIVVFGSVGRFEVTSGSDIDWTYLVDGQADAKHQAAAARVSAAIEALKKEPGAEGLFGNIVFSHNLVQYIGGETDTNANLTRRILLLLESRPIGRREAYDRVIKAVLERYLTNDRGWMHAKTPSKVPSFLHNDIARYWRTVTVDFAYKQWTRDNRGWALRNAKLRMSRKLTYAAGLLYCFSLAEGLWPDAATLGNGPARKLKAIERLFWLSDRTPLDLLADAFVRAEMPSHAETCFEAYDRFLAILQDEHRRERLKCLTVEAADDDEIFQEVRGIGHQFQGALTDFFIGPGESPTNPYPPLTRIYGVF